MVPTWSYSLPASSRLCWMANCSKSSSSSRRASWWVPTTLYPRGTSKSAGSISHARQDAVGRQAWLGTPMPVCPPPTAAPHPPPPHVLRELELLTLEESLLGEGASLLGLLRRELTGSSQPFRFPKVMRALRMWKMGISAHIEKKKKEEEE